MFLPIKNAFDNKVVDCKKYYYNSKNINLKKINIKINIKINKYINKSRIFFSYYYKLKNIN